MASTAPNVTPPADGFIALPSDAQERREDPREYEKRLWAEGFPVVAGTDEAGRGPLAGPVVAAAFAVIDHKDAEVQELLASVADSKQLTEEKRDAAFKQLSDDRFKGRVAWAISEASPEEIDQTNILQASLAAMARAVRDLEPKPDCVLVDGCNRPPDLLRPGEQWTRGSKASEQAKNDEKQKKLSSFFAVRAPATPMTTATEAEAPWRPRRVEAVIHGDARVACISAASIIAKVHRDRIMEKLDVEHPAYGFKDHKGYGTASHMEAIREHGVCPAHRRSVAPVRSALGLTGSRDVSAATSGCLLGALGVPEGSKASLVLTPKVAVTTPKKAGRKPGPSSGTKRGRGGAAPKDPAQDEAKSSDPESVAKKQKMCADGADVQVVATPAALSKLMSHPSIASKGISEDAAREALEACRGVINGKHGARNRLLSVA